MSMPNLLIIGAPRCGTSTMFTMLREVDGIWGKNKEPHFFDARWANGLEYYKQMFKGAPSDAIVMEASPTYLQHPKAPERIQNTLPDAKFVALLREPVARCVSHYWWNQDKLGSDPEVLIDSKHHCVVMGHYAAHLERWFKHFDRKKILIIASEAFYEMPAVYAWHVASWAGIKHSVAYETKFSTTYFDPLQWRKVKYGKPRMPKEVLSWLRMHYKPHNERLRKLLAPFNITVYWGGRLKI